MTAKPVVATVLILLLSGLELAAFHAIRRHVLGIPALVAAARGVVVGVPHWRVYQSRVLGPFLMQGLAAISGLGFARCFEIVMAALVYAKNFAVYGASRAFLPRRRSLIAVAAASAIFLLAQDSWIYPWDLIDVAVSAGIVFAAARPRGGAAPLWALFGVALLNRESSAFVGLFVVIDAVATSGRVGLLPLRPSLRRWRQVGAGAAMLLLTPLVDELLRRALFHAAAMAPLQAGRGGPEFGGEVQLKLLYNIDQLIDALRPDGFLPILGVDLLLAVVLLLFASRLWSPDLRVQKLALLALIETALLPVFGVTFELRIYCGVIPFLALFLAGRFGPVSAISGGADTGNSAAVRAAGADGRMAH